MRLPSLKNVFCALLTAAFRWCIMALKAGRSDLLFKENSLKQEVSLSLIHIVKGVLIMKRAKRISAFIVAAALIATSFTACGTVKGKSVGSQSTSAQTTQAQSTAAPQTTAAETTTEEEKTSSSIEIEIGGNSFSLGGSSSGSSSSSGNSGSSASGEYESEVLYCKNGSEKLYGEMYTPDNYSGKLPVVILAHSYMLNGSSLSAYAEMFAENGYAAYIFDFWGGSSSTRSGGSTSDMTLYTEISDLKAVLSEIRKLDYIDSSSVFLLGTSLGGCVAAMTANDKASQISGLILLYPALIDKKQAAEWSQMGSWFGINWMNDLAEINVFDKIGGFKGDVLILHGDMDMQVPIKFSERAVKVYRFATLVTISGAGHNFSRSNRTANSNMLEYMKKHT